MARLPRRRVRGYVEQIPKCGIGQTGFRFGRCRAQDTVTACRGGGYRLLPETGLSYASLAFEESEREVDAYLMVLAQGVEP